MASFEDQLHAASRHPQDRDEIVKYYSQKYPLDWKQRLAEDIQPYTRGRNGQPQSIKNIRRRFENRMGRNWYNIKPSPAAQAQYQALGETIDQVPERGYRGSITADLRISGGCGNSRSWLFHVTGAAALALLQGDLSVLTQAYSVDHQVGGAFSLDDPAPDADFTEGFCSEPNISIYAA